MHAQDIAELREINRTPALDETQVLTRDEIRDMIEAADKNGRSKRVP